MGQRRTGTLTLLKPRFGQLRPAHAIQTVDRKPTSDHYNTPEHRAWSDAVLARAGGMCQGPRCFRTGVRLSADHIVELEDGGAPFDLNNGQALCGSCHTKKTHAARIARMQRFCDDYGKANPATSEGNPQS